MMSKFEVGETVLYNKTYLAEIFGIAKQSDYANRKYAISLVDSVEDRVNMVVEEKDLQSAKIEIGDIVEDNDRYMGKVISIADRNTDWEIGIYDKNFTERYENLQAAYIHDLKLVKKVK